MYRQMDGYPRVHGLCLKEFLEPFTIGNGMRYKTETPYANGMDCLAGQIIAHFKQGNGSFYLYPAGTRGVGEEYTYEVYLVNGEVFIRVISYNEIIYDGVVSGFDPEGEHSDEES